jgi:hypothetical protein
VKNENGRYIALHPTVNTSSNQRTQSKKQEYKLCLVGVGTACGGEVVTRQMEERKSVFIVSLREMYYCFESEVKEADVLG